MLAATPLAAAARESPGDILPFGLLYGKPELPGTGEETSVRVWSEGGRIHIHFIPDGKPHEIAGSLLATGDGVLKDTDPGAPGRLRIRQPRASRLDFDGALGEQPVHLSVILSGDFDSLLLDLKIDGRRVPERVGIGGDRDRPERFPVEFALDGPSSNWLNRFGF